MKRDDKTLGEAPEIKTRHNLFPIVALGASAGGLEAIKEFFSAVPPKSGAAYVVITHLASDHVSMLAGLIQKFTVLPVFTIEEGVHVVPDSVYVIPPGKNAAISDGVLHLVKQTEPHFKNCPIDYFFRTLACDRGKNAVGVILSGTGSDGSLGAREIKLKGGIVAAQDPLSAKFDGMPTGAVNTGLVDIIADPQNIPEKIIVWLNCSEPHIEGTNRELQELFSLIRLKTGLDFSSYKLNTLGRRIEKQMNLYSLQTLGHYIHYIHDNPDEIDILVRGFLIGVTKFFRDHEVFSVLKKEVMPAVFSDKQPDYCIRVWVPGCSSGEEVYSIAILIHEYMAEHNQWHEIKIFGTDIDKNALATARAGRYSSAIEQDITPERLRQFFTREVAGYKVKKEIRSMVIFGEQNLTKDPPFTRVDMISCRNLMIYLNIKLQRRILPVFHYSLRANGVLVLGMSESIGQYSSLFELMNRKVKIFRRKNATPIKQAVMHCPVSSTEASNFRSGEDRSMMSRRPEITLAFSNYLFSRYVPACILVNQDGYILNTHGNLRPYVKSASAEEGVNVADIFVQGIGNILKSAISTSGSKKKTVHFHGLPLKNSADSETVDLEIVFLTVPDALTGLILIIFYGKHTADADSKKNLKKTANNEKDAEIARLENELRYTRENLQASIEELESSNEELQSMNEELQSTNEEIETSKEELNSLNEELVVTNTELQARIDQLATVHDDMANLFNSTEVATLFLDNNLCIKRFTPRTQEFIHLIPSDVGRSISNFSTSIKYDHLIEDAEEVLRTLNKKTFEVQSKTNRWLVVRILPYRTISNIIDGVIITLSDITEQKRAEQKLVHLNFDLENSLIASGKIFDAIMMPVLVLNESLCITYANRAFYRKFSMLPSDVLNMHVSETGLFSKINFEELLEMDHPAKKSFEQRETTEEFTVNEFHRIKINITKIYKSDNSLDIIMLTLEPL